MPIEIDRLTREYLFWSVTGATQDLSSSAAQVAYMDDPVTRPESEDWITAALELVDNVWKVKSLVGPEHASATDLTPPGAEPVDYQTWVRITDEPERPVRKPGVVTVL